MRSKPMIVLLKKCLELNVLPNKLRQKKFCEMVEITNRNGDLSR